MSGAPAACQGVGVGGSASKTPPRRTVAMDLSRKSIAQGLDLFLELIHQLWAITTQFVRGDVPALLPELLPAQQELDQSIFP